VKTSTSPIRQRAGVRPIRAMIALGVIVGCLLVTVALKVWQDRSGVSAEAGSMLETFAGALGYGAMGYLIATRATGNRLGPLMLGLGVVAGLQGLLGSIDSGGSEPRLPDPMGEWFYSVASACQVLFVGGVVVLLLLSPTGRPLTSRWRWVIWLTAASVFASAMDSLLFREELENGTAPTGSAEVVHFVLSAIGAAFPLGLLAALISLGLRWHRSHGLERQQVSWVAAGGLAGPLMILVSFQLPEWAIRTINSADAVLHGSLVWSMAVVALPAGIAVAVLRHRLYDIDKVVSRTTSYAVVTGVIVAVYVGIVSVATSLFQLPNQISVAVATLTAAAAFRPVLVRTRAIVDRRFNRSRYDAETTVQSFAHRLRDEVDPDIVSRDLLAVLDRTMQPSVAGLWLRDR
jgi:hypothetical protein